MDTGIIKVLKLIFYEFFFGITAIMSMVGTLLESNTNWILIFSVIGFISMIIILCIFIEFNKTLDKIYS